MSTEDDPGCLGLVCCMLSDDTTDAPPAHAGVTSQLPHHSDGKSTTKGSFDETITLSAETSPSLAGDDDKEDGGHRGSSTPHYSSPLASTEALEEDDDASSFDVRKGGDGGDRLAVDDRSKIGEDTLAAGLEDAVQKVMANNKATCTVNANVAVDVDERNKERMLSPTSSKSKKKKTRSGAASSFTRSISKRGSALMKRTLSARRPNNTAVSSSSDIDVHRKHEIDEDEAAFIGRDIDALVLEQEETENARSLHIKERSADQRYVIEYVRDDDDNGEASYNAQTEGVVVSLDASTASLADTNTNAAADNTSFPMIEQGNVSDNVLEGTGGRAVDIEDSAEEGEPVEVVLDESDDESAASSTPTDMERTTATKKKRSSSRPKSTVTSTLKRSVGSLRRGLGSLQRSRSKGQTTTDYCINQDLMLTSTSHHAISDNGYDVANLDDDSSEDSSSLDETSSAQLRRRVVEVETRVQSQISEAKSFDSQQSQYALVHGSTSDHRGIHSSDGRGKALVDLGGYDGVITGGGRLETSDEVKIFKGLPMFIEQGIYDTVIPARSTDENSVAFVGAPATDPVSSGLLGISFDSDEDDTGSAAAGGDDSSSHNEEKDDGAGRKSKRRPLAFLRKKQRNTSANIDIIR